MPIVRVDIHPSVSASTTPYDKSPAATMISATPIMDGTWVSGSDDSRRCFLAGDDR